ncbi:hypothetical protein CEXT_281861 [Caerostris extrusa]|uniref:Uncharacterized protein n=1 Tax=Caerostris extrusa TaxID=172846 RepID=A0AAV4TKR2_CAEEX|nr:hypothetical protein CEXT_281861 [Caerostris extrusa]
MAWGWRRRGGESRDAFLPPPRNFGTHFEEVISPVLCYDTSKMSCYAILEGQQKSSGSSETKLSSAELSVRDGKSGGEIYST